MTFSFIKEYGPIAPMTNTIVDPRDLKTDSRKKRLDKTNGKKKVTKDSKTEDEPMQNPGETAIMNPKESVNMNDLKYDADIHSDGKMTVGKKPDGKICLYGKSYHSHDNHKEVAKKMGMVATDHTKTMGGTRTVLSKEETQNEDMRISTRRKAFTKSGKAIKRKPINTTPHLSGINKPQTQYNSKDWDLDEITSLDETSFDEFINNLTSEEFENLKEGIIGAMARLPFKGVKGKFGGITHNKHGNFRLSTAGRADAAEHKFKKRDKYEKDKARLAKYNAKLSALNAKSLKTATKGALPGHTTGGQKITAGTEYQGGKTMNEMSKIRKALLDVVEKKSHSHGHTDAREKWSDKFKGAGAQQMRKDVTGNDSYNKDNPAWDKESESHKDASKAGRAGPKQSPGRNGGDNVKKGETKIIKPGTPMKDPGAAKDMKDPNVDKAKPSTNEQFKNITDAYASMYEEYDDNGISKVKRKPGEASLTCHDYTGGKDSNAHKKYNVRKQIHKDKDGDTVESPYGGKMVSFHGKLDDLKKYGDMHLGGNGQGHVITHPDGKKKVWEAVSRKGEKISMNPFGVSRKGETSSMMKKYEPDNATASMKKDIASTVSRKGEKISMNPWGVSRKGEKTSSSSTPSSSTPTVSRKGEKIKSASPNPSAAASHGSWDKKSARLATNIGINNNRGLSQASLGGGKASPKLPNYGPPGTGTKAKNPTQSRKPDMAAGAAAAAALKKASRPSAAPSKMARFKAADKASMSKLPQWKSDRFKAADQGSMKTKSPNIVNTKGGQSGKIGMTDTKKMDKKKRPSLSSSEKSKLIKKYILQPDGPTVVR